MKTHPLEKRPNEEINIELRLVNDNVLSKNTPLRHLNWKQTENGCTGVGICGLDNIIKSVPNPELLERASFRKGIQDLQLKGVHHWVGGSKTLNLNEMTVFKDVLEEQSKRLLSHSQIRVSLLLLEVSEDSSNFVIKLKYFTFEKIIQEYNSWFFTSRAKLSKTEAKILDDTLLVNKDQLENLRNHPSELFAFLRPLEQKYGVRLV